MSNYHCALTGYPITDVVTIKQCGHNYQKIDLFNNMLRGMKECEICKVKFTFDDLYSNRMVQESINRYFRPPKVDAVTQTEDVQLPTIIEECEDDVDLVPIKAYGFWSRVIDIRDAYFNPASTNSFLKPIVHDVNKKFIFDNHKVTIFKYVYQSTLDIFSVAKLLTDQGYFVYDLFAINSTRDLKLYMFYSTNKLLNGTTNNLSKLKK